MEGLFLKLFNMSISAGWLILAVIIIRAVLKTVPKYVRCILWGIAALRLVLPFSIESGLSLVPSTETVPQAALTASAPQIQSGFETVNRVINPIISSSLAPQTGTGVNPMQVVVFAAACIWLAGMAVMAVYALISYGQLRGRVSAAIPGENGVWICDSIDTPFILGFFRPGIYLPSTMEGAQKGYVVAHERAHLERGDHVWKIIGYVILTVYWFNPLVWVGYVLFCRDVELACDEKVIREMAAEEKKAYSEALLQCSVSNRTVSACPLAFGEVGVKERIKAVVKYRKPAFWITVSAVIVCVILAVCFLTDPKNTEDDTPNDGGAGETENIQPDDPQSPENNDGADIADAVDEDPVLTRIRSLTAADIKYYSSSFSENISIEKVLSGLKNGKEAAAEVTMPFWDVTLYLTDVYSSEEEHLNIYIGLEENISDVHYYDGNGNYSVFSFESSELYWEIRGAYRTDDTVDEAALEKYRSVMEAKAQENIEWSREYDPGEPLTGYEIVSIYKTDEFERDGAQYEIYSWDAAFTVDDPSRTGWYGGMWLDSELRVRSSIGDTYFAVRRENSTEETVFLYWDLYTGAGDEEDIQNARDKTVNAFAG